MRRVYPLLLAAFLALLVTACGRESGSGAVIDAATPGTPAVSTGTVAPSDNGGMQTPSASPAPSASGSQAPAGEPEDALKQAAEDVVDSLRDRDLERLDGMIDPEKGLRFSPYLHIDGKSDVFRPGGLPTFKDTAKLHWGSYDGSGDPIDLTFRDYFEKFVYNQDFSSAPQTNVNKLSGKGNTPFNGQEIYPDASYVEFHFPGFDKKNDGMDWESLVLVFRPVGGDWKLCAIVHGQWTI